MDSIDKIMNMLDGNNSEEIQQEGLRLAREVKNFNVFFQPCFDGKAKVLWDNCALIVSEKKDRELEPYLYELFRWVLDLNWPGAECIMERLEKYEVNEHYLSVLKKCMFKSFVDEPAWLYSLENLYDKATVGEKNRIMDLICQRKFELASCHGDMDNELIVLRLEAEAGLKQDYAFYDFAKYMYEKTQDIKWLKLMKKMLMGAFACAENSYELALSHQREIVEKENRSLDSLEGLLDFYHFPAANLPEDEAKELAKEITAVDPDNQRVKVLFSEEIQSLRKRRLDGEFDQHFDFIKKQLEEEKRLGNV